MAVRWKLNRRTLLQGLGATAIMPLAMPAQAVTRAPIRLAVFVYPRAQLGGDTFSSYLEGATRAVAEINAAGGARGRRIEIETHSAVPCQMGGLDGMRAAADSKPHAIGNASDGYSILALGTFEAPYLAAADVFRLHENRRTNRQQPNRAANVFEVARPNAYCERDLPEFLDLVADRRAWDTSRRQVHILRAASDGTTRLAEQVAARVSTSTFRVARVTDVADTVRDWAPVLQAIEDTGPSVVVIDHLLRAEQTEFPHYFGGSRAIDLMYLQYAPSELYDNGWAKLDPDARFFWSTVRGLFSDDSSLDALRALLCSTGVHLSSLGVDGSDEAGYAAARTLGNAWQAVEPEDFAAVTDHLHSHVYPFPYAHFSGRPSWGRLPRDRGQVLRLQSAA